MNSRFQVFCKSNKKLVPFLISIPIPFGDKHYDQK